MESSGGRAPGRAWLAMAGLTTAGWVLWRRLDCPNGRNRTIIIGDVHGCEPELVEMLRRVSPSRRCGDRLIFLGDVIGKGPQPLRSLRLAREQVESLGRGEVLMGNHEAAVVRWFDQRDAGVPARKRAKLLSRASIALAQSLTGDEVAWLRRRPYYIELVDHRIVCVHAGLQPGVPLARQSRAHMITTRSLSADGTPSAQLGRESWATRWHGPPHIVFGHDARRQLQRHAWATGLDTGCVYGGNLTAMVLADPAGAQAAPSRVLVHVEPTALWCAPGSDAADQRSPNCA